MLFQNFNRSVSLYSWSHLLKSLIKDCFLCTTWHNNWRFISEAESALATNSTFEYPEIATPIHFSNSLRNLLQVIKNLMFYQLHYTTVFSEIFIHKSTCNNITRPAFYLHVFWLKFDCDISELFQTNVFLSFIYAT